MTAAAKTPPRVGLCILDGWGWREDQRGNAVRLAKTPIFDGLWSRYPHNFLRTDGRHVGLPEGQFGNSEVGHLNLGAGRVVMQDLPRIDAAIEEGLAERPLVREFCGKCRSANARVHLMGLLSPGGVHAHQRHLASVARLLVDEGIEVVLHLILDGRDTPPRSATGYWQTFASDIEDLLDHGSCRIGSVCGRYYAMDRDKRWERTKTAYEAIADGKAEAFPDVLSVIKAAYGADISDEFVNPSIIQGYGGISDGDALFVVNFRADRVRQILSALAISGFDGFDRQFKKLSAIAGMTSYSSELDQVMAAWVPKPGLEHLLGDVIAQAGLHQLRLAETEKYPHVTFFFNGGREEAAKGERRQMAPSPKVATYDLKPEMSAHELIDVCVEEMESDPPDFLLINFANPDMVGHTGVLDAAIQAVETVDHCLGRLVEAARKADMTLIVTADHGNCELMLDPETGGPHTAHTTNPVPVILVTPETASGPFELRPGKLADVAPTVLALLQLEQPSAMTGEPLLISRS